MKIEISIHWSDGRIERHTHSLANGGLVMLAIDHHIRCSAIDGKMHICNVEIRRA